MNYNIYKAIHLVQKQHCIDTERFIMKTFIQYSHTNIFFCFLAISIGDMRFVLTSSYNGFLMCLQMTKVNRTANKMQAAANSTAVVKRKHQREALVCILCVPYCISCMYVTAY